MIFQLEAVRRGRDTKLLALGELRRCSQALYRCDAYTLGFEMENLCID